MSFANNVSGNTIDYNLTLSLTTEHGCLIDKSDTISVFTNPIALFDILEESCGDTIIGVTNNSLFADSLFADSWLWQVSSSTITISDPTAESPTFDLPVNTSSEDSTYYYANCYYT